MNESDASVVKFLFGCVTTVAVVIALSVAYAKTSPRQLGPEYVTINGKKMRCVAIQVTQTETAASCDWDSIRETD